MEFSGSLNGVNGHAHAQESVHRGLGTCAVTFVTSWLKSAATTPNVRTSQCATQPNFDTSP